MARKKKKGGEGKGEALETAGGMRWLITYADMITLLLGLFIILASASQESGPTQAAMAEAFERVFSIFKSEGPGKTIAPGSGGGEMSPQRTAIEGVRNLPILPTAIIKKKLIQSIPHEVGKGKIVTKKTKSGLVVSYHDSLFFDLGSDEVKLEAHASLDKVAKTLEILPNKVIIEGHTDATPIKSEKFRSNWELSTARATNILHYFINHAKERGFGEEKLKKYQSRFSVAGYGQFQPIDEDPYSPQNRRINIIVLDKKVSDKDIL
ncbi:MAG: flagellar motor protein MotB [bacterium]